MLMGVDIDGISIVVFVRVLNMLHYIVQGKTSKRFFSSCFGMSRGKYFAESWCQLSYSQKR